MTHGILRKWHGRLDDSLKIIGSSADFNFFWVIESKIKFGKPMIIQQIMLMTILQKRTYIYNLFGHVEC